MNIKFEKYKTKDYVLLGIMIAFYMVIYTIVGLILNTLLPFLAYVLSVPVFGLFGGIIMTFLIYKINKFGIFTRFNVVLILLFTLFGMIYFPMVISLLLGGLIADFIAGISNYKSKFKNALAYAFSVFGMIGGMVVPIWVATDFYIEKVTTIGSTLEAAELAIKAYTGHLGIFTLSLTFLGAFTGIYLGYAILNKHFKNQKN